LSSSPTDSLAVYIHIPFCETKCFYCDFYSEPHAEDLIPSFVETLQSEIKASCQRLGLRDHIVGSIYFGGGTPSLLSGEQVKAVLSIIEQEVELSPKVEISLEANPGTIEEDQLSAYREAGVNRLSLGVQTFDQELLRFLGRRHSPADSYRAVELARQAGFTEINLDLIYGIPGQTQTALEQDLKQLVTLRPLHISAYQLTAEPGTAYYRWLQRKPAARLLEEEQLEYFQLVWSTLEQAGYAGYEISNFAVPGHECRHNLAYWNGTWYLGFGPAAHSYFKGRRWWNNSSLKHYLAAKGQPELVLDGSEEIDSRTALNEYLFTRLRQRQGFDLEDFQARFRMTFQEKYVDQLRNLIPEFMIIEKNRVCLTSRGRAVADAVIEALIQPD